MLDFVNSLETLSTPCLSRWKDCIDKFLKHWSRLKMKSNEIFEKMKEVNPSWRDHPSRNRVRNYFGNCFLWVNNFFSVAEGVQVEPSTSLTYSTAHQDPTVAPHHEPLLLGPKEHPPLQDPKTQPWHQAPPWQQQKQHPKEHPSNTVLKDPTVAPSNSCEKYVRTQ